MIKLKLTLVIFLFCACEVNAQRRDGDKIYWVALEKYTKELKTGYPSIIEKTIYLQKPDYIDSIPALIGGCNIVLITASNQKKLYREHHNKLINTIIFPATITDSIVSITITPYRGALKGSRHYNLGVSDGTTVYFKYDCEKKQFIYSNTKNWGI